MEDETETGELRNDISDADHVNHFENPRHFQFPKSEDDVSIDYLEEVNGLL